ncbi:MAG: hypothetical protein PEPC_01689 [Peptostreptococcus russellii]
MDEAVSGLTELAAFTTDFNSSTGDVAGNVAGAILTLLLLPVVWAVATKKDNARIYVIVWFVLILFTIIFIV